MAKRDRGNEALLYRMDAISSSILHLQAAMGNLTSWSMIEDFRHNRGQIAEALDGLAHRLEAMAREAGLAMPEQVDPESDLATAIRDARALLGRGR